MSVPTTTPVSPAPAPAPVNAGSNAGLPVASTFCLWQMLATLMKYQKELLDLNADQQKNWAQNLGGPNGIFAKLYAIGCKVGQEEASALRSQAYGSFAAMGASLAAVGFSAAKYATKTNPQLNEGDAMIKNAKSMESALLKAKPIDKPAAGLEVAEAKPKIDVEAQNRLNGWANGSEPLSKINNKADADLNERAIAHAANDDTQRGKILERIQSEQAEGWRIREHANTEFNSTMQLMNIGSDALGKAAEAGGAMGAAKAKVAQAEAQSGQSILSQVQQSVAEQEKKAEEKAQAALSEAKQDAQAFAQAAAAQVHA